MIAGPLNLAEPGHVPPDRLLAFATTIGTGVFIAFLFVQQLAGWVKHFGGRNTVKGGELHQP